MGEPGKICPKVFCLRNLRIHRFDDQLVSGINSHRLELLPSTTIPVSQNELECSERYEYLVHFVLLAKVSSCFRSANIASFQTLS